MIGRIDITSMQSMRAFMVILFCMTAVYLIVTGQQAPDYFVAILGGIVGYYFAVNQNDSSNNPPAP